MSFPTVAATATTNGTAATTTPVVNLPTGITAGQLLIVAFRSGVAGAIGWPAGWTEMKDESPDTSTQQTALAWRKADGTEGTTITLSSGNGKFAAVARRITGAADPTVTPPEITAAAVGSSTAPDPGLLTPTGGAKDYLWLWVGTWEGEQTSPPASQPTNYIVPVGANSGTAGVTSTNCRVASAQRSLNAASENPPSWTISATGSWAAYTIAVHPGPVEVKITAVSATGCNAGDSPTLTWQCNNDCTAWRARANSTNESDGQLVASGGAVTAGTPTVATLDTAAMLVDYTSGLRVWVQVGGVWYRNIERRPWAVIFDNSADWTLANFQDIRNVKNLDVVVLAAFWDRLQSAASGDITADPDWTALTNAVADCGTAGLKIQLDMAVQYPPTFAKTDIPKFQNQSAQKWSTTIVGRDIRDWVWSSLGRQYLGDFMTQVVTNIDKTKLFSIRLGGGNFNELMFPDARAEATFTSPSYWGHGAAPQTGVGLASGMTRCPLPGYVLFVGGGGFSQSAAYDNKWINWYLDSLREFMLWQIDIIRKAGWTGRVHVMHPSFGIRSDWPTSDTNYRIELMQGADTARMIFGHALLDDVHPYSTWLEDVDRGSPLTVDSNKASWRKIADESALYGKDHSMLGENAGAGATAAQMDFVVNGAAGPMLDENFRASMWLHFSALQGLVGGSAVWADYTTETAQNQEGSSLADGIERYLLVRNRRLFRPQRDRTHQLASH